MPFPPARSSSSPSSASPLTLPSRPKLNVPAHTFPLNRSRSRNERQHRWVVGQPSLRMLKSDRKKVQEKLAKLDPARKRRREELEGELQRLENDISGLDIELQGLEAQCQEVERKQHDADEKETAAITPYAPQVLPFISKFSKLRKQRTWLEEELHSEEITRENYNNATGTVDRKLADLYSKVERILRPSSSSGQPASPSLHDWTHHVVEEFLKLRRTHNTQAYALNSQLASLDEEMRYLRYDGFPRRDEQSPPPLPSPSPPVPSSSTQPFFSRSRSPSRPNAKDPVRPSSSSSDAADLSGLDDVAPEWAEKIASGRLKSKRNLRSWFKRGRSWREEGGSEGREEHELARRPNVGLRAARRYYGRAY
ncbi:hypothetical protein JCM6882_004909 [Rhodosporidiobolus microsporus]